MSIRRPERSLRRVERVPIVCPSCGHSTTLTDHSEPLDHALVNSTYLHELGHELGMLERAEQFFARFPSSKHHLKVSKMSRDPEELREIQDDPVFEKALRAEPELYKYLTERVLLVPGRLTFVRERIHQLQEALDSNLVMCPACKSGRLTIEDEFFQRL